MGPVGWFELRMEEENRKFEDTIPQRKNLKFWIENKLWSSPYNIIQHIYFIRISILPHCDILTEKYLKAFFICRFRGKSYDFRQFWLKIFQIYYSKSSYILMTFYMLTNKKILLPKADGNGIVVEIFRNFDQNSDIKLMQSHYAQM